MAFRKPSRAQLHPSKTYNQMPIVTHEESGDRPSASVMAVAVVQFAGSIVLLIPSGLFLFEELQIRHRYPSTYRLLPPAVYVFYIILPIGFALLGIVSAIGLGRLREWGRKTTLFLATAPATVYLVALMLRPPSIFPSGIGGIYLDAVAAALSLVIPICVWWLVLLTRPGVKAQFRSADAARQ